MKYSARILAGASLLVAAYSYDAFAQGAEKTFSPQRMQDQVERLERDLNILQQQFYRGDNLQRNSSGGAQAKPIKNAAEIEVRLTQMEERIRDMNGRIEQAEFTLRQFAEKLDKIIADIDTRINQLEVKPSPVAQAAPAPLSAANTDDAWIKFFNKQDNASAQATAGDEEKKEEAKGDPERDFSIAVGLLRQAKYDKAAEAFKGFIDKYPDAPQKPEAHYWLGEVYYVQKNYEQSSVQFLKSYQTSAKGPKAPDSLLKLGVSLGQLKKTKEACATFEKARKEFTSLTNEQKQNLAAQRALFKCPN